MDSLIPVIVLFVLGVPIALAIWLIVRTVAAGNRIDELSRRLGGLEAEVYRLKRERESAKPVEPESKPATAPEPAPVFTLPTREQILQKQREGSLPAAGPVVQPEEAPVFASTHIAGAVPPPLVPPPIPPIAPKPEPELVPPLPRATAPAINWEQFLGVKGFAWAAGLAFFLGIAFAIKYSFDHNLISPELRMAFGFLTGVGLARRGLLVASAQAIHRRGADPCAPPAW